MAEANKAGEFVWHELMTRDGEKAGAFYTGLLGWSTRTMAMDGGFHYTIFTREGQDAGGMMVMEGEQFEGVPPHWMLYVSVADVDASAARAEKLGGQVRVPPFDVPKVGRMAVIQDPTGAVFSIFKGTP